jgi:hypothetical protein
MTEATGESGYPALVAAMNLSLAALSREIADAACAERGQRLRRDRAATLILE